MLKAAIYCRLSDAGPGAGDTPGSESIHNQKSLLLRYAVTHGFEVEQIYVDEDRSGTDPGRPGFRRMIRDAEARRFDVILVKTQSRFTRDLEESELYLHRKFPEWGIRLIAVMDGVDTDAEGDLKKQQLNGLVNEWYLEELSANVQVALSTKRQQGKYLSAFALYGYKKDPADHNRLLPNPETAPVVQRIFALHLAGYGAQRIAMALNAEGILAPSAYKKACDARYKAPVQAQWSNTAIRNILKNPIYTGDMVQGRCKKASYKKSTMIRQPPDKWVVVPGTHEPLVSREIFARAQEIFLRRQTGVPYTAVWRPLAKKVKCGGCGGGMMMTGGPGALQMRCLHNRRDPRVCTPNRIPLDELEAVVLARLHKQLAEVLDVDELAESLQKDDQRFRKRRRQLNQKQKELRQLEKQMQELYFQRTAGDLSAEQFASASRAMTDRKKALEQEVNQLHHWSNGPKMTELREKLMPYLRMEKLTKEMADALIQQVTVWPAEEDDGVGNFHRKIEIAWNF